MIPAILPGAPVPPPGWDRVGGLSGGGTGDPEAVPLGDADVAGIRARGKRPYLHAASNNTGAIRLYEKLGFAVRTPVMFGVYRKR